MIAQVTCSAWDLDLKRLVRYWGMVMESSAAMEKARRRGASKIQLSFFKDAATTEIYTWPRPRA